MAAKLQSRSWESPGPKPQNEVSLELFLGLFIDPVLSTNIWSDIYGGVRRAGRGSSDHRSGVCHISLPPLREALSGIFLCDCSFTDARIDGGWGSTTSWNIPSSLHGSC